MIDEWHKRVNTFDLYGDNNFSLPSLFLNFSLSTFSRKFFRQCTLSNFSLKTLFLSPKYSLPFTFHSLPFVSTRNFLLFKLFLRIFGFFFKKKKFFSTISFLFFCNFDKFLIFFYHFNFVFFLLFCYRFYYYSLYYL